LEKKVASVAMKQVFNILLLSDAFHAE